MLWWIISWQGHFHSFLRGSGDWQLAEQNVVLCWIKRAETCSETRLSAQARLLWIRRQIFWWCQEINFQSFMEMWLRFDHLQCSHPVRAMHEEPEAQVTQANTGWKWSPGCHLCNVTLPLRGWVNIQEAPSTTYGDNILNYRNILLWISTAKPCLTTLF